MVAAVRIALGLNPRAFISENVPGAAFGKHQKYLNTCLELLKTHGYICQLFELAAADFGVPQLRKRLFLFAAQNNGFSPPRRTISKHPVLRDAIIDLASPSNGAKNHDPERLTDPTKLAIARCIAPGQKLCNVRSGNRAVHTWDIPEVFGSVSTSEREVLEIILRLRRRERRRDWGDADPVTVSSISYALGRRVDQEISSLVQKSYLRRIGRRFDLRHTFNGKYRRLQWDKPSFTVDTRFGDPKNFLHPDENRGLSVREAARIQGFGDDFLLTGTIDQQFQMVGNAVPPPLSAALARSIRDFLLQ